MKDIMRKHLWPAALVAALAVVGMLAAFVVLTGPQRGTAEAQGSVCAGASGAFLQGLIQAGVCPATSTPAASPSPTTGGGAGSGPSAPGGGGGAGPSPVAPNTPEPNACSGQPADVLAGLIAAGVCQEPTPTPTITPTPTATPTATPVPTAGPTPTARPTAQPPQDPNVPDAIESSSTSANATVKLELTIGNLPMNMLGGSSIELYLEDDFKVPDTIDRGSVYFTVENPLTDATSNGSRVYATDPIEIDTDGHFTDDKDDYAIQVVLPDFNTADRSEFDGFNGPTMGQTLTMVFTKSAGIKNPSEAGTHSVGYAVLGPNADPNDGPTHSTQGMGTVQVSNTKVTPAAEKNAAGADSFAENKAAVGLKTLAKIGLSDVDNKRGYELTVTGTGFNNGTSAAVHILADPDTTMDLRTMVDAGGTDEALACREIIQNGHRVGIATVESSDTVAVSFEVTAPIFKPGNVNFICMVDGEGRSSNTDVEDFELEPSIRVSPKQATVGDRINVFAQDFPTSAGGFTSLEIANQVVYHARVGDTPAVTLVNVSADNIGRDGSATATFDMPGSVNNSPLEGTVRIDAEWGSESQDDTITLTGSTLRLSVGEVRANESLTIQGEGFGNSNTNGIERADITIDGVPLLVDPDSLDNNKVEVSSAGQFVATVYVWGNDASNPALTAGTHTIRVRDTDGFYGTASIIIKEPGMNITPDVLGPREYLTVTGTDWPVDNQDSTADIGNVEVEVEGRNYTVIPDATGRFTVQHRVSRDVAIPSTQSVKATYTDTGRDGQRQTAFVKTASFEVPAATIEVDPTEGQPGDEVSLTVTGMPVYAEVEEITIGGARVGTAQDFRTDREGDVTADGLAIPGLDPGTYSVVMKVGSGDSQTVAIGSIRVLTEVVAGAVAQLPGALEALDDNLEAVFYFDNISKEWSFYDPREDFADLNTLSGMVAGQAYWILVGEAVDEVVLNGKTRGLTCSNGDCWNLVVW